MKTKLFAGVLATTYVFAGFSSTAFGEENSTNPEILTNDLQSVVENMDKEIVINDNGVKYNTDSLVKDISDEQLDSINSLAKAQGLDVVYTKESFINEMVDGLKKVDQQIEDGELEVLSDGTMIESEDDNFYLQGGSTYTTTHYWGKKFYKSQAATKNWAYKASQLSLGHAAAGGAVAFLSLGAGFIVGGIMSTWYGMFANSLNQHNNKRGTVSNITWAMLYKVRSQ